MSEVWWHAPIKPAIPEAEVGKSHIQGRLRQFNETVSKILKRKHYRCSSVVKHLLRSFYNPCEHKTKSKLSAWPSRPLESPKPPCTFLCPLASAFQIVRSIPFSPGRAWQSSETSRVTCTDPSPLSFPSRSTACSTCGQEGLRPPPDWESRDPALCLGTTHYGCPLSTISWPGLSTNRVWSLTAHPLQRPHIPKVRATQCNREAVSGSPNTSPQK